MTPTGMYTFLWHQIVEEDFKLHAVVGLLARLAKEYAAQAPGSRMSPYRKHFEEVWNTSAAILADAEQKLRYIHHGMR